MAHGTTNHFQLTSNSDAAARVETVRSLNPILDVVAEHVQLRRSGSSFRGLCCFHEERSPSLYVHPAKGLWTCHACHVGGDVFTFIMQLQGCTFTGAVTRLAARAGLDLNGYTPSPKETAAVEAKKREREAEVAFREFLNTRLDAINQRYRSLARAATNAETCLRSGKLDTCEQEMAWAALERYRLFEASVEREGLCDLEILKREWRMHDAA